MSRIAGIVLGCLGLVGCERAGGPASGVDARAGDSLARGETLSLACQACHSLERGGGHSVGPNLYGIFGRRAASADGFDNYSQALRQSGIVWSAAELDRWLEDPDGFLPGTTMGFTGYQSPADRQALIEYLLVATGARPERSAE